MTLIMIRRLLLGLAISGLAASGSFAEDKPAKSEDTPEFRALQKEFQAALMAHNKKVMKEFEEAKKAGKKEMPALKMFSGSAFSKRFLEIAEKDPDGPSAVKAISVALGTGGGPKGEAGTWKPTIKLLREHFATKTGLKHVLRAVANAKDADGDGDAFIREVIAKNPDRKVQAEAYQALIGAREQAAEMGKMFKEKEEIRQRAEKFMGKEEVARMIAGGDSAEKEAEELKKALREKYADVVSDLSIGRPMPELMSEGLDGKTVKLSDYKGKVVVLDIWATWCGPCRAMIPHEREMVERLKDKPFQLVSISSDEEKKTLTDFLAKEKMPWAHWWNGSEGKLIDTLNIEHYPTIFVLDGEGVIRFKEIRGEELEKAVNDLLKEMEAKKTAAK